MTTVIPGTDIAIPLPPPGLRLMGDTDEQFTAAAVQLTGLLYRLGLRDDDELLDVGCGVGRLAVGLLAGTGFKGRYVGFDVMARQVEWAKRSLSPIAPEFHFRRINVRNDRYNPNGTVEPASFRFPARTGGFDLACLLSIFTHFYKEDIQLYLHELHRVLQPGGTVVSTWMLYDEDRYEATQTGAYPMVHRLDEVTIYNDPDDPLRAIAFHIDAARAMIAESGLEIVDIEYGTWAGGPGPEFQDVVVLRKPGTKPVPATVDRSLPARVKRRLKRALGR